MWPDFIEWAQKLAANEGIFTGVSGGSTFAIAMQIAEKAEPGSVILAMLPDTGERYMSTPLFESIPEDMSEEEEVLISFDGWTSTYDYWTKYDDPDLHPVGFMETHKKILQEPNG